MAEFRTEAFRDTTVNEADDLDLEEDPDPCKVDTNEPTERATNYLRDWIPADVRKSIFELVLGNDDTIRISKTQPTPDLPALAAVCKNFRSEALQLLYSRNSLIICVKDADTKHAQLWLQRQGPSIGRCIRKLEVRCEGVVSLYAGMDHIHARFDALAQALFDARVCRDAIVWTSDRGSWFEPVVERYMQDAGYISKDITPLRTICYNDVTGEKYPQHGYAQVPARRSPTKKRLHRRCTALPSFHKRTTFSGELTGIESMLSTHHIMDSASTRPAAEPASPQNDFSPQRREPQTIPAELRNLIYEFVLATEEPVKITTDPTTSAQPALTRVCKQFRAESLPMFYSSRRFVMSITSGEIPPGYKWLSAIGSGNARHTRNLEVWVDDWLFGLNSGHPCSRMIQLMYSVELCRDAVRWFEKRPLSADFTPASEQSGDLLMWNGGYPFKESVPVCAECQASGDGDATTKGHVTFASPTSRNGKPPEKCFHCGKYPYVLGPNERPRKSRASGMRSPSERGSAPKKTPGIRKVRSSARRSAMQRYLSNDEVKRQTAVLGVKRKVVVFRRAH